VNISKESMHSDFGITGQVKAGESGGFEIKTAA
jgi:hypothetical protein